MKYTLEADSMASLLMTIDLIHQELSDSVNATERKLSGTGVKKVGSLITFPLQSGGNMTLSTINILNDHISSVESILERHGVKIQP